eukprot:TRINITY_DN4965_c0_g1_i1.p1 TRINITY_DN4965_c0_g1~~TRINITY_DN4965_c0_g1_i1.p1  ORF type:complete len:304 (+),score=48.43 TRINITY_DN4965_c0_g1_i1:28-912(+)
MYDKNYDIRSYDDDKFGGCCRHRWWGWKEIGRVDLGMSALGWKRYSRAYSLFTLRIVVTLWSLGIMCYSMALLDLEDSSNNGIANSPWWTWGIYFSNWSYFSLVFYFVCATYLSYREIKGGDTHSATNYFERYLWINFEIAWAANWASTITYWLITRHVCTFEHTGCPTSIGEWVVVTHIQGANVVWLSMELMMNMLRFKPLHVIFPIFFSAAWCIFAAIWNNVLSVWPYAIQNTSTNDPYTAGFYVVAIGGTAFFFFCGFGCAWGLEKWYKSGRREEDTDFHDGSPKVSSLCC